MEGGSGTRSTHFTPPTFPYFLLLFLLLLPQTQSLNITSILSSYPSLSTFSSLLSSSSLPPSRDSLTLLAVPNSLLPPSPSTDSLRFHILLRFLTWSDLRQLPPSGSLIPTLLPSSPLNLSFNPSTGVVSLHSPNSSSSSATFLSLLESIPHSLSIFTVSALLSPPPPSLLSSNTAPYPPPSPGVNITKSLIDGHDFNVAASLLSASGVVEEFESDELGAGLTLFIPTDSAFSRLPSTLTLQSLPADKKSLVLKFHVLHSYYPLGSLQSIVNPVQPTLATEDSGAGRFTLNISSTNGSVALDSGLVQAVVTQTVFDQNPVAIFGISNVLLPKEIFGDDGGGSSVVAQPPVEVVVAAAPEALLNEPSHLSPGSREEGGSDGGEGARPRTAVALFCTVGVLLLYVIGDLW